MRVFQVSLPDFYQITAPDQAAVINQIVSLSQMTSGQRPIHQART